MNRFSQEEHTVCALESHRVKPKTSFPKPSAAEQAVSFCGYFPRSKKHSSEVMSGLVNPLVIK